MNTRKEVLNILLKSLNPTFLIKTLCFYLIKIIKIRDRFSKPVHFYPPLVQKVYYQFFDRKKYIFSGVEKYNIKKCEILLCSNKFLFIDESTWFHNFEDQEESFSLHRWNWLLTSLNKNRLDSSMRNWGFSMMRSWINNMMNPREGFAWHPYTIGERISNAYMFGIFTHQELVYKKQIEIIPADIKSALSIMALHLVKNIEHKGVGRTGNHVINNARALLFAYVLLDDRSYLDISFAILKSNLPDLITEDGFLREGSSHYQFIFTRWVLEILWLTRLTENKTIYKFILPYASKLVRQCNFFLVSSINEGRTEIPLFGDVSPDYPIYWLKSITKSILAQDLYESDELNLNKCIGNDWASLINQKSGFFLAK